MNRCMLVGRVGRSPRSCSVIPRRSCRRRASDPSTSRWSTSRERRCPTWGPPTSSSARTTWRAKSSGSRPPPTRWTSPFSSTTAWPPRRAVPHMRRALPAFLDVLMAPAAAGPAQPGGHHHARRAGPPSSPTTRSNARRSTRRSSRVWEETFSRRVLPPQRDHRSHPGIQETRVGTPRHRRDHRRRSRVEQPASGPGSRPRCATAAPRSM